MILDNFFYLDICSLILLVTLIFYSCIKRLWSGLTHFIHIISLIVTLFTILFHLSYLLVINLAPVTDFTYYVAAIYCYLFLITQSLIYPIATVYVLGCIGILYTVQKDKLAFAGITIFSLIPAVMFLINPFSHYLFYFSRDFKMYVSNAFHIIYLVQVLQLVSTFVILVLYRRYLSKISFLIGVIFYPINILILAVQPFFPSVSFIHLSIVISCYIISLSLERSEIMNSEFFMARSSYSFYLDANTTIALHRPSTYIFVKLVNHRNIQKYLGKQNYSRFLNYFSKRIYHLCRKNKFKINLYYLEDSAFVAETEGIDLETLKVEFNKFARTLLHEIKFGVYSIYADTRICIAKYPEDIYNLEYLKYFAKQFHEILPATKTVLVLSEITSDTQFVLKNEIEFIINRAFKDDFFELYFQPIYSHTENRFVSAEALIRLNDPNFGNISPAIFVSFAENSSLIYKISDFVFDNVSQFIISDEFEKLGLDCIEINLATSQCLDPNLYNRIKSYIDRYNIDPSRLRLEITEKAMDINPGVVEKNILKLRDLGITFALDNYGTGYSDVKRLISFPIDIVKLDPSFIDEYNNPRVKVIVDSTVKMLKELNKQVLIEGIEEKNMAEEFFKQNCDLYQGYYFSKPLPKEAFLKLFQ